MEDFLSMISDQVMKYAIRSGIALISNLALSQSCRLLEFKSDKALSHEFEKLQDRFQSKVKIISPAIDLIEFKSYHGNAFLEAASPLAKSLHDDILKLSKRMQQATDSLDDETLSQRQLLKNTDKCLREIIKDMKCVLARLDREIPLLQLAISASGETFSASIPACISPSRLLQASAMLTIADSEFASNSTKAIQVGPVFALSVYMLFSAYCDTSDQYLNAPRLPVWQEVIHKAKVTLSREPLCTSRSGCTDNPVEDGTSKAFYSYSLVVTEDRYDGRVHETLEDPGIKETIAIGDISKLFYTNSGKILNITEAPGSSEPVLLLRRDVDGMPTSSQEATTPPNHFPLHLDPEWIALQMYECDVNTDIESSVGSLEDIQSTSFVSDLKNGSIPSEDNAMPTLDKLALEPKLALIESENSKDGCNQTNTNMPLQDSSLHTITTSLSLLEMIIRLAALQQSQQTSHLSIPDHILTFFLEEASSPEPQGNTGTGIQSTRKGDGLNPTAGSIY